MSILVKIFEKSLFLWKFNKILDFSQNFRDERFLSPGALAENHANLEKVDGWNFQESYLDAHLTPWWKVLQNPGRGNVLFKMAAITTSCLLLYPKTM